MAKITVVAVDKEGNEFPKEIDQKDVEKYRQIAEAQDFGFRVVEPLTEEEKMAAYPPPSGGESLAGGLLQGITATLPESLQEMILGKEEKTRLEAGKPTQYGIGTTVGSAVSGIGYGALGTVGGGAIGSLLGPAGVAGGALIGGALGGGLESYLAEPSEEDTASKLGSAAIATGTGLIPGAAVIRPARKLVAAVKKLAEIPGVETAAEKIIQQKNKLLSRLEGLYSQFDIVASKRLDPNIKPGADEYIEGLEEEFAKKEQDILKNIRETEKELANIAKKETAQEFAIPGVVAGAGGGAYSGLSQIKSPEQLAELNRQAAQRAYEEAVRKKSEKILAEGEVARAEAGTRSLVEEQTAAKLRKLNK